MLSRTSDYEELCRNFTWRLPEYYNIGVDVCDKWAERAPDRVALLDPKALSNSQEVTFSRLRELSNKFANELRSKDVVKGDRVAILLPQCPAAAVAHIAVYKLGAIAVPLTVLFGPDALQYRLAESGAKAIVAMPSAAERVVSIRQSLPDLRLIYDVSGDATGAINYEAALQERKADFVPEDTTPNDPAVLIFTSGTTGRPKGALHGHRILLGHLPGVELSHEFLPHEGDRFWTPADWAWIGGLYDVLMPALHHGIAVVCFRDNKFDPEHAFKIMEDFDVRNVFIPPTALRMMRTVRDPKSRWNFSIRSIASGGETLGSELQEWGRETFGTNINEFYGQTECNMVISSCSSLFITAPGKMGRAVPGHVVAVVDDRGKEMPHGAVGDIAVRRPNPAMLLQYWRDQGATEEKYRKDWLITGDKGTQDPAGAFHFVGRDDDLITSAGYRIGPGEIEDCLIRHPAVRMAAVVGKADSHRTQLVKAFIVLNDQVDESEQLKQDIQEYVKSNLAAYEYPREIEFIRALPVTTTGKVIRRELRDRG